MSADTAALIEAVQAAITLKVWVLDSFDTGAYHADGTAAVVAASKADAARILAGETRIAQYAMSDGGLPYDVYRYSIASDSVGHEGYAGMTATPESTAKRFDFLMTQRWRSAPIEPGVVAFNFGCDC